MPLGRFKEAIDAVTTLNIFLNDYGEELEKLCDEAVTIDDEQQVREFNLLLAECDEWNSRLVDLMAWIQSERYETRMEADQEKEKENELEP